MVAQWARGWLVYIAHFHRLIKADFPKEIARYLKLPGPILSCSVSNLAQNNEHWRVIVKLGGDEGRGLRKNTL